MAVPEVHLLCIPLGGSLCASVCPWAAVTDNICRVSVSHASGPQEEVSPLSLVCQTKAHISGQRGKEESPRELVWSAPSMVPAGNSAAHSHSDTTYMSGSLPPPMPACCPDLETGFGGCLLELKPTLCWGLLPA